MQKRYIKQEQTGINKRKSLIITGLGAFLGTFDSSIVNVSLPTISHELSSTMNMTGWIIMSYSITIVSLLLVFGALAEKRGFSFIYSNGFVIFFVGSFLCGISASIYFLILFRVIQGIGAAMLMASGPALITKSFPENERGRGLSVIAMVVSVGLMTGPPLGGFITGLLGWRWIFFINIPICLVGLILTLKFLRNFPIINPNRKISVPASITLSATMFSIMITILMFSRNTTSSEIKYILPIGSLLLIGLFLYFESNHRTRLVGLDIFKNRIFAFSTTAMFLVFISLASVTILVPFFLEHIKFFKPQEVGLFLMTIPICGFFISPVAGYLSDKIQPRYVSTFGILVMLSGIYLLRYLDADTSSLQIILVLVLLGIGMALFTTPNTSAIMGSVQKISLGVAAGINAATRTLGLAMGVGLSMALFEFFQSRYILNGSDTINAFIGSYQMVYNYIIFIIIPGLIFSWCRGNKKSNKSGCGR